MHLAMGDALHPCPQSYQRAESKVGPGVLLLQVEGTMPRMCGLGQGQCWECLGGRGTRNDNAGDIWLSRTNARDIDGWDNTRAVSLSRDVARDAWPGREDTRDVDGGDGTRDI